FTVSGERREHFSNSHRCDPFPSLGGRIRPNSSPAAVIAARHREVSISCQLSGNFQERLCRRSAGLVRHTLDFYDAT
ncbi:MAG: hypothetical protein ACRDRS_25440, partial [Pseudonocardiaceae bacterium]